MITVSLLKEASEEGLADLNRLMDQLRKDNIKQGTFKELQNIVADPNVALAVAQDGERIVGTATLYIIH